MTAETAAVGVYLGEPYQREQALQARIQALRARAEWGGHVLEGAAATPGALGEALFAPSLFERGRWVLVRHADEADPEALLGALQRPFPPDVVLLLELERLDKRGALYKWLKAHAQLHEFAPLDRRTLPGKVKALLQERGVTLTAEAFQALLAAVPPDLMRIQREVEKLALYAGKGRLELADVQGLVFGGEPANVFQCFDALGERRPHALGQFQRLLEGGEEPGKLFFMLAGHLRGLLAVKALQDEGLPPPEVARRAGLAPWLVQRRAQQARRWTQAELIEAVHQLHEADLAVKQGASIEVALTEVVLAWTRLAPAEAAAGGA